MKRQKRKPKPRPLWVVCHGADNHPLMIFGGVAAWPIRDQAIADVRTRCGPHRVVRYAPGVRR